MRYFIQLAYNGTRYHGWQIQPNNNTVQEELNKAVSKLFNEPIMTLGCGRTDTGVHASLFYAHFDTDKPLLEDMVFKMNAVLPWDITVYHIFPVYEKAHARFHAYERVYDYFIHFDRNPFMNEQSFRYHFHELNFDVINQATDLLLTYDQFKPLSKRDDQQDNYRCVMTKSHWSKTSYPNQLKYTVGANRFLRSMVRRIVGSFITLGRGQMTIEEFIEGMDKQENFKINIAVPPQGLFLTHVQYDIEKVKPQTEEGFNILSRPYETLAYKNM